MIINNIMCSIIENSIKNLIIFDDAIWNVLILSSQQTQVQGGRLGMSPLQ